MEYWDFIKLVSDMREFQKAVEKAPPGTGIHQYAKQKSKELEARIDEILSNTSNIKHNG